MIDKVRRSLAVMLSLAMTVQSVPVTAITNDMLMSENGAEIVSYDDYVIYDSLAEVGASEDPLLELSELSDATVDAIDNGIAAIAAPVDQEPITVDNTTIERITIRWLSNSDGSDEPAYYDTLKLKPDISTDRVTDQQFQIDFALSGQQAYQPGMIELVFPARIWLDRNGKEPGGLTLSVPEDPGTSAEFVWTRRGDNIVITNATPIAAASKVMIQGTFRNVIAHEMIDGTKTGDLGKFNALLTVVTPYGNQISMTSNDIDAEIDTCVEAVYAAKTAYDSTSKEYNVWWSVPGEDILPEELRPDDPENYVYVRWYVSGTAKGNQPYKMYVEDTIAKDEGGEPLYGGIMLGVTDSAEGTVKAEGNEYVKALLYEGYSAVAKSAYVWTAYPKDGGIPEDITEIPNEQKITVTGIDGKDPSTFADADATVKTKGETTYTFIKYWDDQDDRWGKRPDKVDLNIYWLEYSQTVPWKTVTLTAENSSEPPTGDPEQDALRNYWTYSWTDESQVRTFKVGETLYDYFGEYEDRTYYDQKGVNVFQWQYHLMDQAYDEETHTWTFTNQYDDGYIPFELSEINKSVEYKFADSDLISTRDELSLNKLLKGESVLVKYPVRSVISAAEQSVWYDIKPNRFVLEDGDHRFNDSDTSVDDVEIAQVDFMQPVVYEYVEGTWEGKEDNWHDRELVETPDTTLYGKIGDKWVKLAVMYQGEDSLTSLNDDVTIDGMTVTLPEGVSRIKTELLSEDAVVYMNYDVTLRVKPSEKVVKAIEEGYEAQDYQMMPLLNKANAYAIYEGNEQIIFDNDIVYDPGYRFIDMEDPATGYLHGRQFKVAADLTKSFVMTDNDVDKKRITMSSELTLTQQSNVTSREAYIEAVENGEIPNTNEGMYYDLLPAGVDPILETVKAGNKDIVLDKWIEPNYKGSGRTLLAVKVKLVDNISQTSANSKKKYTENDYPKEGYKNTHTLTFDSYCTWDAAMAAGGLDNMHNVSAYRAAEGEIGSLTYWEGEPDDPSKGKNCQTDKAFAGNEKDLMTDLYSGDNEPGFVYAGADLDDAKFDKAAVTELDKSVQVTGSGVWSKGEKNDVNVQEGGLYTYRLTVSSATDTTTSDIILLDSIEQYVPRDVDKDVDDVQWKGSLVSIDLSQVIAAGVAPVVYYSTVPDLDISSYHAVDNKGEITDGTKVKDILTDPSGNWKRLDAAPEGFKMSDITAIAVDISMGADNKPFELSQNEVLMVNLNMRAPYDKTTDTPDYFKGTDGTDHMENAHAYNSIYLDCKQVFNEYGGSVKETYSYINSSYTKVGIYTKYLDIIKEWDDGDDADGLRPDEITVELYADDDKDPVETITLKADDWKGRSKRLLTYNDNGTYINYTFKEIFENSDEYPELTVKRETQEDGNELVTLINTHDPEKMSIPITKTWDDDGDRAMKRPSSITLNLYANKKFTGQTLTIRPDENGDWYGEFTGLDRYYNKGKPVEYSIVEIVDDYVCKEDWAEFNEEDNTLAVELTNSYHPYGELRVTKKLETPTPNSKGRDFTFSLELKDADGSPIIAKYDYIIYDADGHADRSGTIGNGGEFSIKGGETFVIDKLPTHIEYTVTESRPVGGYELVAEEGETGEILSWRASEVTFTNAYTTKGSAVLEARKELTGRKLAAYAFRFEVTDESGENVLRTAYNNADGEVFFGGIGYTNDDKETTFVYKIREVDGGKKGFTYVKDVYTVKVTPHDNGDGTMSCDVVYINAEGKTVDKAVFTNKYEAKGEVSFRAWKTIDGGSVDGKTFNFKLYDATNNKVIETVTNDEKGVINFSKIKFDQDDVNYMDPNADNTYWYFAREVVGDDETIEYTDTIIGYCVEVVDNGDGTLSFDQSSSIVTGAFTECSVCKGKGDNCADCHGFGAVLTGKVNKPAKSDTPVFDNAYEDGVLAITKRIDSESDQEFKFKVKLIGDKVDEIETDRYTLSKAEDKPFPTTADLAAAADKPVAQKPAESISTLGNNDIMPLAAYGNDVVASGYTDVNNGVKWTVYSDTGVLLLEPANGNSGTLTTLTDGNAPWKNSSNTITTIKLSGNIYCDTRMLYLFANLPNLTDIDDLARLDTSMVENISGMFKNCTSLTNVNALSTWNVKNISYAANLFNGCTNLSDISGLSTWQTDSLGSIANMFRDASSIKDLDALRNWNTSKLWNTDNLFMGCSSLEDASALGQWYLRSGYGIGFWFNSCYALKILDCTNWDDLKADKNTFQGVNSLSQITIGNYSIPSIAEYLPPSNGKDGRWIDQKDLGKTNAKTYTSAELANVPAGTYVAVPLPKLTITYDLNGGGPIEDFPPEQFEAINGTVNATITKKIPKRNGYTFVQWEGSNGYIYPSGHQASWVGFSSDKELTLTAQWEEWDYKVVFKSDENGTNTHTETKKWSENYKLPSVEDLGFERDGWEFTYWTLEGSTTPYSDDIKGGTFKENNHTITLVANWAQSTYKIDFEGNGANGGKVTVDQPCIEDYLIPDESGFTYHNHYFAGWKIRKNGVLGSKLYEPGDTITARTYTSGEEIVLVAQWNEVDTKIEIKDGEFEFTMRGGYTATFENIPAGTSYQVFEETPNGWVLVKQVDPSGIIEPCKTANAEFYNLFDPAVATVTLNGTKYLDGRPASTDAEGNAFEFELFDEDGRSVGKTTAKAGGLIQFEGLSQLRFSADSFEPGDYEYTFTIKEVRGKNDDLIYDTTVAKAIVTVSVKSDSTISATVAYCDDKGDPDPEKSGVEFRNTTRPGSLEIGKTGQGMTTANEDTVFNFLVKLYSSSGAPLTEGTLNWYTRGEDGKPVDETEKTTGSKQIASADRGGSVMPLADDEIVEIPDNYIFVGSGECGTVTWEIYSDGGSYPNEFCALVLKPTDGVSGTLDRNPNWYNYSYRISAISVQGNVKMSKDASNFFMSHNNLRSIEGLEDLDVSDMTSMSSMFSSCGKLTSLKGIENWDVSNVKNMSYMFNYCSGLTNISAIKSWNVGNVEDMNNMFGYCSGLTSLEALRTWDVSSVKSMNTMFGYCSGLTSTKGIENWTPCKVTDLSKMFNGCGKLTSVDLSGWADTVGSEIGNDEAVDISAMFSGCYALAKLYLTNWDNALKGTAPIYSTVVSEVALSTNAYNNFKTIKDPDIGWIRKDKIPDGDYRIDKLADLFADDTASNVTYVWNTYYKVTLDAGEGDGSKDEYRFAKEDYIIPENTFSAPPDKYFAGWLADDGKTYQPGDAIAADTYSGTDTTVTLTAQWNDIVDGKFPYTVYSYLQDLNDPDKYELTKETREYDINDETETVVPVKYSGYTAPGSQTISIDEARNGKMIEFRYEVARYTISFNGNGADTGFMPSVDMVGSAKLKLSNNYLKNDALFLGWNTQADGKGDQYNVGSTVSFDGNTTLYAQWLTSDEWQAVPSNGELILSCKAGETIVIYGLPAGTTYEIEEIEIPDGWTELKEAAEGTEGEIYARKASSASVINTYSAKGSTNIVAHKLFEGGELTPGRFKFELFDSDEMVDPIQTRSNGAVDTTESDENDWYGTAPVVFDGLVFTEEGDYTYYIREQIPGDSSDGIIYDEHVEKVIVRVKDNGNGTMSTEVIYDDDGALFKNDGSGELTVSKTFIYNEKAPEEIKNMKFDFMVELTDADGKLLTGTYGYTIYGLDGEETKGAFTANKDHISIKGGEKFTITGLPNGTKYVVTEEEVAGIELEEYSGTTGTIRSGKKYDASFTNVYSGTASLTLKPHKIFEGGEIGEKMFEFTLKSGNDVLQRVFSDTEGNITFDPIIFTTEDLNKIYTYTVSEIQGGRNDIQYDYHEAVIKVKITRGEDGAIVVNVLNDDGSILISDTDLSITADDLEALVFTNATLTDLTVTKTVIGDVRGDGVYEFKLAFDEAISLPENIVWEKGDKKGVFSTNKSSYEFKFELMDKETIRFIGLPLAAEYTITETKATGYTAIVGGERTNIASDKLGQSGNDVEFVNIASVFAAPEATKKLLGTRSLKDGEFSFTMSAEESDGIIMPEQLTVNNDGEGKVAFDEIEFTKAGSYTVDIIENNDGNETITYDTRTFSIVYEVTEDSDGVLSIESEAYLVDGESVDELPAFENTFTPASVSRTPAVSKKLTGRTLKDGEFSFTMSAKESDGMTMPKELTAKNDGEGKVTFDEILFTKAGSYTVDISEDSGKDETITYDTRTFSIVYEVTQNSDGELIVEETYLVDGKTVNELPAFENTYTEPKDSGVDGGDDSGDIKTPDESSDPDKDPTKPDNSTITDVGDESSRKDDDSSDPAVDTDDKKDSENKDNSDPDVPSDGTDSVPSSSDSSKSHIDSKANNTAVPGSNSNPSTGSASGATFMMFALIAAAAIVSKKKK